MKTRSHLIRLFAAGCLSIVALGPPPLAAQGSGGSIELLVSWMSGDFTNREQVARQDPQLEPQFDLLGLQRRRVDVPVLGGHVIYAQINDDADVAQVYRQRFFVFSWQPDGRIAMTTWAFADSQAHKDILSRLSDLAAMPASAFKAALPAGCEARWRWTGDSYYSRISAEDCVIVSRRSGEPLGIQATEIVSAAGIRNEESGYTMDGEQTFGFPDDVFFEYLRED